MFATIVGVEFGILLFTPKFVGEATADSGRSWLDPSKLEDLWFFDVLNAPVHGSFTTYDTVTNWLNPFQV